MIVTKSNIQEAIQAIERSLESENAVNVDINGLSVGKWGMARLWRSWVAKASEFMAKRGATVNVGLNGKAIQERPFNAADGHELFTLYCLGCDVDGMRLSWAKKAHDGMKVATRGQRFDALRKLEIWCVEKGIVLFKPADSEYCELEREQNN